MADSPVIGVRDLELEAMSEGFVPELLKDVRAKAEREAILAALMSCDSISDSAKALGVTRPTLYNLINKYGLETQLAGKQSQSS